jgi:hypothetical protein
MAHEREASNGPSQLAKAGRCNLQNLEEASGQPPAATARHLSPISSKLLAPFSNLRYAMLAPVKYSSYQHLSSTQVLKYLHSRTCNVL